MANKIVLKDLISYDVSNLNLIGFVNIVAIETCMGEISLLVRFLHLENVYITYKIVEAIDKIKLRYLKIFGKVTTKFWEMSQC